MTADIERSQLPASVEWKAAPDGSGELEGYISVFHSEDLSGDIVQPGAFKKTFNDWKGARNPLPLILDHDLTANGVIGRVTEASEDGYGAKIRALFLSTTKAQDVRQKMLELGGSGMSFTYVPIRSRMGIKGGLPVRYLEEVKVIEATVTWTPLHQSAYAMAKAVSDRPWGDYTQADYTPEQWAAACIVDKGVGDPASKERYALPVKEPNGDLSRGGVHAAAARINQVQGISSSARQTAARTLIRYYGQLGEDPPESLRRMAGQAAASYQALIDGLGHALAISDIAAQKAAVDQLLERYRTEQEEAAAEPPDGEEPTAAAAAAAEGTAEEPPPETPEAYALRFIKHAQPEPPDGALAAVTAVAEAHTTAALDALEADILRALGGATAR